MWDVATGSYRPEIAKLEGDKNAECKLCQKSGCCWSYNGGALNHKNLNPDISK